MAFSYPTDAGFIRILEKQGFIDIEDGRMFKPSDKYVAILSYSNAYDIFEKDITVGDKIKLNNYDFEVIGIRKKTSSLPGNGNGHSS